MAALLIAFGIGFLLAWYLSQKNLPRCGTSVRNDGGAPQTQVDNAAGHGSPVKGSGEKLGGPGEGDSSRKPGSGTTTADGGGAAAGAGTGGDGQLRHGSPWQARGEDADANGSAKKAQADAQNDGAAAGDLPDGSAANAKTTPSQQMTGAASPDGNGPPHPGGGMAEGDSPAVGPAQVGATASSADAVTANDLRYDRSELPRYSNAVTQTGSGAPAAIGPRPADPNVSVSTIMTKDDLPTVAAWYHEHLPHDWSEQNLGRMAMFWPPDRKADPRTVWLIVDPKTGQTGAILWKARSKVP
jgi:hypothetical protein